MEEEVVAADTMVVAVVVVTVAAMEGLDIDRKFPIHINLP